MMKIAMGLNNGVQTNSSAMTWAAIAGKWHFGDRSAKYEGPLPDVGAQQYGIGLTSWAFTEGSAKVRIKFGRTDPAGNISGGLLLGFQSERSRYLLVQLGAYGRAYSVAEYVPGIAWKGLDNVGAASNLQPNREYQLDLRLSGQEIRLNVDGVPVIHHLLSQPLEGKQLGLFGWGNAEIEFSDLSIEAAKPQIFVAMQFGEPFDTLYREVIVPTAEAQDLGVLRVDEITRPGIIFEDIKRKIAESTIVIAEITAPNQNVFYELGYAHALNKPTILLAQRDKQLPFDIRSYRVIFYDDSIGGKPVLETTLQKHLASILHNS